MAATVLEPRMSFGEVSPVCALPLPLGTSFLQELVVTLEPAAAECEAQENPIVEPVVAVAVPVEIVVFVLMAVVAAFELVWIPV